MKRILLFVIALLFSSISHSAATVNLSWDASESVNVGGYKLFYGGETNAYTSTVDVGNVTSFQVTGLADSSTYYFALKAYNVEKTIESAFSNEVMATTPGSVVIPPLPNFSSVNGGFTVKLTPEKCATCTNWAWKLPGSITPNVNRLAPTDVNAIYRLPGTYAVTLTITDSGVLKVFVGSVTTGN